MDKSVDRVHVSMDRPGVLDPPWTDAGADSGHGGLLTGAQPPAAPVRQSSPAGWHGMWAGWARGQAGCGVGRAENQEKEISELKLDF
jgi:hypothetical protein